MKKPVIPKPPVAACPIGQTQPSDSEGCERESHRWCESKFSLYRKCAIFQKAHFRYILLLVCCLQWTACSLPSDVFEKDVSLPSQQWESSFRPTIRFTIKEQDTAYRYNIYLVLRHTDAYNYNNIWIRGTVKEPGDTAVRSERYNLSLATNKNGWTGSGMDDIFEHRIQIQQQTKFKQPGTYSFTLEQIMREDPLKHVLNVGVRIEKVPTL